MLQRYNNGDVDGVMELMDPDAQCEQPSNRCMILAVMIASRRDNCKLCSSFAVPYH